VALVRSEAQLRPACRRAVAHLRAAQRGDRRRRRRPQVDGHAPVAAVGDGDLFALEEEAGGGAVGGEGSVRVDQLDGAEARLVQPRGGALEASGVEDAQGEEEAALEEEVELQRVVQPWRGQRAVGQRRLPHRAAQQLR